MIFVTPKVAGVDPVAFNGQSQDGQLSPWTHLQIMGNQLIVFDKDGDVLLSMDLRMAKDVRVVRQAEYDGYTWNGNDLIVLSKPEPQPAVAAIDAVAERYATAAQRLRDAVDQDDSYDDDDYSDDACDCPECTREAEY